MTSRMLRRYLRFLLLGWLLLGAFRPAQADCLGGLQDYRVALQAYEDGLLDPAVAGFRAYLQKCPEAEQVPQAHYFLAEIFHKRQQFTEALDQAEQVLADKSGVALHLHARLLAAQCLRQLGRLEPAQAYLQQALASGATGEVLAAALYWLGELAEQQQRYDDAQAYYQRLMTEQPHGAYTAYAQFALGWLYQQRGEPDAALQAFSALLTLAPTHVLAPRARFARAALLRETKQFNEAALAFKQLAEEGGDSQDEALFWWGELSYQLGRFAEARIAYERLVTQHPQSQRLNASLYGWGWTAVRLQQCAAALEPWDALLLRAPQFSQAADVHYQLGVCHLELEQPEAARRHLLRVVEIETGTARSQDALLRLGTLAFRQGAYAEAIEYHRRALTTATPEDALRLHYLLGESYAAMEKPDLAIAEWNHVLAAPQTFPLRAQARYRLGSVYETQRAWAQVVTVLRQLWDEAPNFAERTEVAIRLAHAYSQLQQCAEALPFYDTIVETTAEETRRRVFLGAKSHCLLTLGRYEEVVDVLAPLVATDADVSATSQMLYTLGQAYIQLQRYQEALLPLSQLHQRFPHDVFTLASETSLAVALEKVGNRIEALRVWKSVLQRQSDLEESERARLQLHAGRLAFDGGHFAEVLDFLASLRASTSSAVAAEALFLSGEAYFQQQQWELALQVYQGLLDRHLAEPHWSALARLRLGTVYEQQHDWERALSAYQALLERTTNAELLASVRQRIAAIKAGQVLAPPASSTPLSEG